MTTEQLTGRILDHALAAAMGSQYNAEDHEWTLPDGTLIQDMELPSYSTSIEALVVGPERMLRNAGAWMRLKVSSSETISITWWVVDLIRRRLCEVQCATEAEARARAALAALKALKEQAR